MRCSLSCVALVGAGTKSTSVDAATGKKLKSTASVWALRPPWVPEVILRLPGTAVMSCTIASTEYLLGNAARGEPLRAVLSCSQVPVHAFVEPWRMSLSSEAGELVSLSLHMDEGAMQARRSGLKAFRVQ